MADGDSCLLLRTLLLVEVMQAVRHEQGLHPGFVFLEHPADPVTYAECKRPKGRQGESATATAVDRAPSMWVWPEVRSWLDRMGLHVARFDQGYFGHEAVKPTQIATNSGDLWEALHAKIIPLSDLWQVDRGSSVEDRIRASKSHAAWAPSLVTELQKALKIWIKKGHAEPGEEMRLCRFQAVCSPKAVLSKVDKHDSWKQHCMQGHVPWRKDCIACLESAAYMRPHRRQKHPVLFNMMADLAGPYQPGQDTEVRKGRHILMVVYPFPKWRPEAVAKDEPIPDLGEFDPDEGEDPTPAAEEGPEALDAFELELEGVDLL